MVFQNPSLFKHLTVEDNISYGLRCMGMRRAQARKHAADFLERLRMGSFAKRWPESLSGGEAQRVALARTLIVQPRLVLLDEPLSALDAPLRKSLGAEIRSMQKSLGFTALMVTHDLEEAKAMSDRIILIKEGKLFWQGRPDEFTEDKMS